MYDIFMIRVISKRLHGDIFCILFIVTRSHSRPLSLNSREEETAFICSYQIHSFPMTSRNTVYSYSLYTQCHDILSQVGSIKQENVQCKSSDPRRLLRSLEVVSLQMTINGNLAMVRDYSIYIVTQLG